MRKLSPERFGNFPKSHRWVGDETRIGTLVWSQRPHSQPLLFLFLPDGWGSIHREEGPRRLWNLLSASAGFGKCRDGKAGLPRLCNCALSTPWPLGELERLLTTQERRVDRPQIGMGSVKMRPLQPLSTLFKGRAQLWASCRDGAHKDQTAFINRTRPWEGVS